MRKYLESILEYLQLFLQGIAVRQFQLRSCMWLCCCYIVDGSYSNRLLHSVPKRKAIYILLGVFLFKKHLLAFRVEKSIKIHTNCVMTKIKQIRKQLSKYYLMIRNLSSIHLFPINSSLIQGAQDIPRSQ